MFLLIVEEDFDFFALKETIFLPEYLLEYFFPLDVPVDVLLLDGYPKKNLNNLDQKEVFLYFVEQDVPHSHPLILFIVLLPVFVVFILSPDLTFFSFKREFF